MIVERTSKNGTEPRLFFARGKKNGWDRLPKSENEEEGQMRCNARN